MVKVWVTISTVLEGFTASVMDIITIVESVGFIFFRCSFYLGVSIHLASISDDHSRGPAGMIIGDTGEMYTDAEVEGAPEEDEPDRLNDGDDIHH